jgi:hypothetical protein
MANAISSLPAPCSRIVPRPSVRANYTPDFTAGAVGRVFEKARFLAPVPRLLASQRVPQSTSGQADDQRAERVADPVGRRMLDESAR